MTFARVVPHALRLILAKQLYWQVLVQFAEKSVEKSARACQLLVCAPAEWAYEWPWRQVVGLVRL